MSWFLAFKPILWCFFYLTHCAFFCWTCDTPASLVRVCAGPHFVYFAEAVHFCPVGALASNLITPRM